MWLMVTFQEQKSVYEKKTFVICFADNMAIWIKFLS